MNKREQYPSNPSNWLYKDYEGGERQFTKYVRLGKNAKLWAECTQEEKDQWEREHPEPEPEPEVAE